RPALRSAANRVTAPRQKYTFRYPIASTAHGRGPVSGTFTAGLNVTRGVRKWTTPVTLTWSATYTSPFGSRWFSGVRTWTSAAGVIPFRDPSAAPPPEP